MKNPWSGIIISYLLPFSDPQHIPHTSSFIFPKKVDHATFPLASQGLEDKVKIWQARAMANGLRPLSNLITSKTPLSTVTLNHFQFPSLALMCPTLRPLLKSISSYNWPVLSICPKPQPIKVLSSLRTYLKYHLLQEGFSNFLPKLSLL